MQAHREQNSDNQELGQEQVLNYIGKVILKIHLDKRTNSKGFIVYCASCSYYYYIIENSWIEILNAFMTKIKYMRISK